MQYSTSSTTTIAAIQAGGTLRIPLIPRGPSSRCPQTLSPVGDSFQNIHTMPSPTHHHHHHHHAPLPNAGSNGWGNQQSGSHAYTPPMAPRMRPIPLPRLSGDSEQGAEPNPLLERTPSPWIEWDLSTSPRFATLDPRRRVSSPSPFLEPATRPYSSSLTIRTPFSTRPIVIQHFGGAVTVIDVLTRVHEHLWECASESLAVTGPPQPMSGLLAPPQHPGMVDEAQIQHTLVQMLGRKRRWEGLALSPAEPDVWLLHVR